MENKISVVIPAYNEQDMISVAYNAIKNVVSTLEAEYEIIFVDDGSADDTYANICLLAEAEPEHARGISFSRNFGKEAAVFAGMKESTGNAVIVMDCDLQHPVEVIPEMVRLWKDEGVQIVQGVKKERGKENRIYKAFANLFNEIINGIGGIDLKDSSDFILMDRCAVDSLIAMPEKAPFFRGLSRWIGFKTEKVPFEVAERTVGESKWSVWGLIKYALHNIVSFSAKPLQLVTVMGIIFVVSAVVLGIQTLCRYFTGNALGGFTTVITLILLTGGIIMVSLGIIGIYIAQIYNEIKARPRYIISKRC